MVLKFRNHNKILWLAQKLRATGGPTRSLRTCERTSQASASGFNNDSLIYLYFVIVV